MYWSQELARQTEDAELAAAFTAVADALAIMRRRSATNWLDGPGLPPMSGGYIGRTPTRPARVMRPSSTFNDILGSL